MSILVPHKGLCQNCKYTETVLERGSMTHVSSAASVCDVMSFSLSGTDTFTFIVSVKH